MTDMPARPPASEGGRIPPYCANHETRQENLLAGMIWINASALRIC